MPKTRLQSLTNPRRKLWWQRSAIGRTNKDGAQSKILLRLTNRRPAKEAGQINIAVENLKRHVVLQLNRGISSD